MLRLTLAAVGALLAGPALALDGSLVGTVRTLDGAVLPQVVLTLHGPGGSHTVVTGPEGRFRAALPVGAYTVTAETPGLVPSGSNGATVGAGESRLDLVLGPATLREQVVVSATRSEAATSTLGTSVSVIDRERIEERAASSTLALLQDLPGVTTARTGPVGAQGSVFVRGGESRYARVFVDGVPLNQPGGAFDFGNAVPLEWERVEVVRGAASSLYGTDALAGVVHFVTRRGQGDPSGTLEAEGGDDSWLRLLGSTAGRSGAFDWNVGLQRLTTDNEGPNHRFEQTAGAASLGARIGEGVLRVIVRADRSDSGTPGPTALGRPDLDATFEREDRVGGASYRWAGGAIAHELRAGLARTRQLTLNPLDSGPYLPTFEGRSAEFEWFDFPNPAGFQNDTDRSSFGYQAERQLGGRHLVTAGVEVEHESGELGSRADARLLSPTRTNFGAYLQDRLVLGERVYATVGGRFERNDSFGGAFVPRASIAWRARPGVEATTVRASGGAGIKEPDFFQSFGVSQFAQGNPDLEPERSRTFDLGVEQRLLGGRASVDVTAFHHDYLDQIAFALVDPVSFRGTYVNLGKTRARGLEVAVSAQPTPSLTLNASYTWLDGEVIVSSADFDPVYAAGQPLLRRPENQASFSARWTAGRVSLGATVFAVGERADSDFQGILLETNEGYARLDARARVRVVRRLEAFVVAENLADREYQEALGYPAPGRTVRFGLRFRAGRP